MTDEQGERDREAHEAFMAQNRRPSGLVIASDVWHAACAYARREAVPCKGVPAPGCKYLMACGCICNKCGQIHDDELRRHAMLAAAPPAPVGSHEAGWRTMESAPARRPVLIHYKNACGNGRTIKARFVPRWSEQCDNEDCSEYSEDEDDYFALEGWYEKIDNLDDYGEVFVHQKPIAWMPLPPAPNAAEKARG